MGGKPESFTAHILLFWAMNPSDRSLPVRSKPGGLKKGANQVAAP